jgi:hypothetical protein
VVEDQKALPNFEVYYEEFENNTHETETKERTELGGGGG